MIKKWLNDNLSEAELEEFRQREDYNELAGILEQAQQFKASHFSRVDSFKELEDRISQRGKNFNRVSWMKPLLRIAAVLALGIGVFYIVSRDNLTTINTVAGEKKTIDLPDASSVVINALSEIQYDKDLWKKERIIELSGEAFFDVEKGSSFIVNTKSGSVSVLGTEFNVKQRSDYFEVYCYEGRVQVSSGAIEEFLEAGEHLRLAGEQLELGKHTYSKPGWTQNLSSFQKVPFREVIADLERQYDIRVSLKSFQPDTLFTGAFVHDDLENALLSITEPLDLKYTLEDKNQVSIYPSEN